MKVKGSSPLGWFLALVALEHKELSGVSHQGWYPWANGSHLKKKMNEKSLQRFEPVTVGTVVQLSDQLCYRGKLSCHLVCCNVTYIW